MITEEMLADLRTEIGGGMSPYRFRHTAEVETMVERLAALYAPEDSLILRAAVGAAVQTVRVNSAAGAAARVQARLNIPKPTAVGIPMLRSFPIRRRRAKVRRVVRARTFY